MGSWLSSSADPDEPPQPSYLEMFRSGKEALINSVIRPPRSLYSPEELGPKRFEFVKRNFTREDLTLTNPRGHELQCSWWRPEPYNSETTPCIVYMHGNSSCRLEATSVLSTLLSTGASVFAFDFSACGLSEGEFISLGAYEKDDLLAVLSHLRVTERVHSVALWGRSMGAVTALFHAARDPAISCLVLDSPFADFYLLARDLVEHSKEQGGMAVPSLAVTAALAWMRSQIKNKAKFDLQELNTEAVVGQCAMAALFLHGEGDILIRPSHCHRLCSRYKGHVEKLLFDGDHNSDRGVLLLSTARLFLIKHLRIEEIVDEGARPFEPYPPPPFPPWALATLSEQQQQRQQQPQAVSFPKGTLLVVWGLKRATEFNNREVVVHMFDPVSEKYVVVFTDDSSQAIKLNTVNLRQQAVAVYVQHRQVGDGERVGPLRARFLPPNNDTGALPSFAVAVSADREVVVPGDVVEFAVGCLVVLVGLRGSSHFNGKLARVVRFDSDAQRYEVQIDEAGSRVLRVKRENITP